jgi:hypothetical protein
MIEKSIRTMIPPLTVNRSKHRKHDSETCAFDHDLLAVILKPVQDTVTKVVNNDKDRH